MKYVLYTVTTKTIKSALLPNSTTVEEKPCYIIPKSDIKDFKTLEKIKKLSYKKDTGFNKEEVCYKVKLMSEEEIDLYNANQVLAKDVTLREYPIEHIAFLLSMKIPHGAEFTK